MANHFKTPVFVLGLPRSGTSMLAGALARCGAWSGTTIPATDDNPRGFYEHAIIREQVTKAILRQLNCDPLGVKRLPPVDIDLKIPTLAQVLKKIIEKDGYRNSRPWFYKDAKLSLVWPLFADAFPKARWVYVKRDTESFVNSCLRTQFMHQHSKDPAFWQAFAQQYMNRIERLKASGASVYEISTPPLIGGDFADLQRLIAQLGLRYNEERLRKFISPAHWHGDASGKSDG